MEGTRAGWYRWPVAAATAAVLALPAVALADVDDDPAVQRAREEAERAQQDYEEARDGLAAEQGLLGRVTSDLDRAAAAYERAAAHHERLRGEEGGSQQRVAEAAQASETARKDFASQVADLYRRGPLHLRLTGFVLDAESPSTALHRAGLLRRISTGGLRRLSRAERVAHRTADDARQQHVVTVGSEAAAASLALRSDELAVALQAAQQRVDAAQGSVAAARADVARADAAVEETVTAARERLAWQQRVWADPGVLAERGQRLPPVDGKVCPIGAPHGFGDSWLAPRPGGRQHLGVDMFAVHGMPLYAVTDGTVRVSNNRLGGLVVHLHADDGDRYYYAHLSAVSVSTGDRVRAGDVIGANGNSGNARTTPPHLHWQYHPEGGAAVNPFPLARALCR